MLSIIKTVSWISTYGRTGVSAGARTRTEGVGGLYGIQFHHGHMLYSILVYNATNLYRWDVNLGVNIFIIFGIKSKRYILRRRLIASCVGGLCSIQLSYGYAFALFSIWYYSISFAKML